MADVRTESVHAATRDVSALEAFFVAHYGRLIRLAGLVCGEMSSAEDIVQTALERAWRSRHAVWQDAAIGPWLDRIVVREAARERRARFSRLTRLVRSPGVAAIDVPGRQPMDQAASRFPERAAVRDALARLTAAHRAVVVLHLHAGYTIDETADILAVPRETVRSRLRVARDQLRHSLEEAR